MCFNCFFFFFIPQSKFDCLDPEVLNSQVTKYAKFVTQLEKGLPPNSVVPQLKQKVEKMKEKVRWEEGNRFRTKLRCPGYLFAGKRNNSPVCFSQQLAKWCNGALRLEQTLGVCYMIDKVVPRC